MLQCTVGYGSVNLLLHKSTARQHVHGSEFLTAHLEEKKKKLNEANLARFLSTVPPAHHSADNIPVPQGSSSGHTRGKNEWSDVMLSFKCNGSLELHRPVVMTLCKHLWCGFPIGFERNSMPGHSGTQ